MRIMIPKVKCSKCLKRVYINTVPIAYVSGNGETIYICSQCKIHDNPEMLNAAAKDIAFDADAGGLAPATAENFELMRG